LKHEAIIPAAHLQGEGHANQIKMLKRQMFARAGFELLPEAGPAL
jgi:hypothetical protein